ncbi:MAG: caspase family protein [Rubrivivax sp.]|jgi:tetratricopeptide (TPR) repeat protein
MNPRPVHVSAHPPAAARAAKFRESLVPWLAALVVAIAGGIGNAAHAAAEPRFALVIGNGSYSAAPLPNAGNDANAVAKVLQRAGFTVDLRLNAGRREMQDAVQALGQRVRGSAGGGNAVGLFYYAGHALQLKGRNYLMPVGVDVRREEDVAARTVDVQVVLDSLAAARNRTNVVILDACRDNPFVPDGRKGAGGLSQLDAPTGSLIAFATSPGTVASDGKGANGLYTQHLLANIERPGTPIEEVFKRVRLGVRLDSNGAQVPWESTSLEADFAFFPEAPGVRAVNLLPPPPGIEQIGRAEAAHEALRNGRLDEAERGFRQLAGQPHPEVVLMGREGLAEVFLRRGQAQAALTEANAIIALAPTRSTAYLIRGRALAMGGQMQESAQAVQVAAARNTSADFSWQKADALVALGNLQHRADPKAAAVAYQGASRENPRSLEAISNLAVALDAGGDGKGALAAIERAQALAPGDATTAALARQIRESLASRDDRARQAYIDSTAKELAERLRNRAPATGAAADDWTSPVLAVAVLPFQDQTPPSLAGRIGMDAVLQQALMRELQARGFTIVERRLLDQVMAEAKLGSSELADQDTQVRLGRVLAARLLVTGTLVGDGAALSASVRAIDTETTRVALLRNRRAAAPSDPEQIASGMAQEVQVAVAEQYPLKGRVVRAEAGQVIINLGKKHGLKAGQAFNVLGQGEAIEHNGRVLGHRDTVLGRVTVTQVDELLAYARVSDAKGPLTQNLRVIARNE